MKTSSPQQVRRFPRFYSNKCKAESTGYFYDLAKDPFSRQEIQVF